MADTPRKTLDEIRRQINADFAEAAIPQAASEDEIADRSHPATQRFYAALAAGAERKLRRPSRRSGYLIAGLIGAMIGQIVLLCFMGLMRHRAESGTSSIATPAERVATMPPSSTSAPSDTLAARESLAPAQALTPSAPPRVTPPTEVAAATTGRESTEAAESTAIAAQTVVDPRRSEQRTVATSTAVTPAPETPASRTISAPPPS